MDKRIHEKDYRRSEKIEKVSKQLKGNSRNNQKLLVDKLVYNKMNNREIDIEDYYKVEDYDEPNDW